MSDMTTSSKYPPLSSITAMILAGGKGTRLRPVIGNHQKVIAEIAGEPFLVKLLEQLNRCGLQKVILCTGFHGNKVAERIGKRYKNMRLCYSREPRPLGTGGALRFAFDHIDSETVLILNGDSYFSADLREIWIWHKDKSALHTVVLAEVPDVARFGQVIVDRTQEITNFAEKGCKHGPGWINAGIYFLHRDSISTMENNQEISIEHDVFPNLVGKGLYGYKGDGYFIDIGTPESFREVELKFQKTEFADTEAPQNL
ncbi:MAG: nucleotidyltransferase family protein [Desulfosarcinaceae bacterium]